MMRPGCRYEPFKRVDHTKATSRYQGYTNSHGQGIFQFIRHCKGGAEPESSACS